MQSDHHISINGGLEQNKQIFYQSSLSIFIVVMQFAFEFNLDPPSSRILFPHTHLAMLYLRIVSIFHLLTLHIDTRLIEYILATILSLFYSQQYAN